jgi:hypothetical protein
MASVDGEILLRLSVPTAGRYSKWGFGVIIE